MTGAAHRVDGTEGSQPAPDPTPAGRALFYLEDASGAQHYLETVATVGRAEGNDIRIASQAVSRYHAMLRKTAERWSVIDLDSRNGTRINGEVIPGPRLLNPNDLVQFGDTPFVFRSTAEARGAPPPGAGLAIVSFATPHFRLLFQPGSFADRQREVVGERLERAEGVLAEMFERAGDAPLGVYLLDQIIDPARPGETAWSDGYLDLERRTIYAVYRSDSPGTQLERSLVAVALHGALGADALRSSSLREGLFLFVLRRSRSGPPDDESWTPVIEAAEQGSLPSLRTLLTDSNPEPSPVNSLAAAHLLDHLSTTYGLRAVGAFLAHLRSGDLEGAARGAFGASLHALERVWRGQLRSASLSGFRLFVKLLFPYLRPYRWKVVEIACYVTLSAAFGVVLAKATGFLIDRALLPRDYRAFQLIMAGLVGAFVVVNLGALRENYLKAWVSERILRDMRLSMFAKVQSLHHGYFERRDSGDLITRLTSDLQMVEGALTAGVVESIRLTLMLLMALAVIFFTEWRLAVVVAVGAPLFYLTGRYLGRPVARASFERQNQAGAVTNLIHENLGAQPVIKLFGLQRLMIDRFSGQIEGLFRSSLRLHFLGGLYGLISTSIANVIELAVLGIGAYLVLEGRASTGTLFTFILLLSQIIMPMQTLSQLFQFVQQGTGSMKRVNELIGARPAIDDAPQARPLDRLARAIQVEHVAFSYDESRLILQNVSLTIPAGANVALVGPSGSGKSTVLNLLTRFYDPQHGRVRFDGVDLREATVESVRAQIGMVFQESILFDQSIRENIRLGHPAASDEQVETAARAAELHEFIQQLPEGYDTIVGERGGHLSGGQRQRVAIARAIIRNPALLLLDEATSALDPATEAAINATLRRLAAGRTTVSVTHRLASVVHADQIYVLEAGQLVEQGTHDELLRSDGLYARLWEEQQGGMTEFRLPAGIDPAQLRRIPLFAQLDRGMLAGLAANLVLEQFAPGADIVTAGTVGDRLFIVKEGQVEVLAEDWAGGERRLAVLAEGDYFGEIALLRDIPRTATVRARSAVETYSLSQENFQAMLAGLPALRAAVTQTVVRREDALREVAARGFPVGSEGESGPFANENLHAHVQGADEGDRHA